MAGDTIINLAWAAAVVIFWIVFALAWRARRKGGSVRAGVIGATYEWLSQDKRRAMELVVEERAEEGKRGSADGNLPELEDPDQRPSGTSRER
jgi:hypothetical protein